MKHFYLTLFVMLFLINYSFSQAKNFHWETINNTLNGVTITWENSGSNDSISWGYSTSYESGIFAATQVTGYNSNNMFTYTFPVLQPSSTLYYKIYDSSNSSWVEKQFTTSVDTSSGIFTFVFGGDCRGDEWDFINPYMQDWQNMAPVIPDADFTIYSGDIVEEGDDASLWDIWLDYGQPFLSDHLTYHCIGNHDNTTGSHYNTILTLPGNELYYSFEFGNSIFICLNSENADDTLQDSWLVQTLQTYQNKTWKFVFFHRPFYTIDNHAGEMDNKFDTWWQAFDDYGVDVLITGHSHHYIRTVPINRNIDIDDAVAEYGSEPGQGRLQVVSGGLGAFLSLQIEFFTWYSEVIEREFHYCIANVNGNTFSYQAITQDGTIIDEVTLTKSLTNIENEITNSDNIIIYPNPSNNTLSIYTDLINENIINISVINMTGICLKDIDNIQSDKYILNTSSFSSGIYYIRIYTNNNVYTKKVAISN